MENGKWQSLFQFNFLSLSLSLNLFINPFLFSQSIQIPQIEFSPLKYISYKADDSIIVDGNLNELSWEKAEWTSGFTDIAGPEKPAPRFLTRAKMLWDDSYFYVAAEISEPDIWATLKNRDDIIFYDNDFEVFIDPDGDTRSYSEFEINALNTVWDLLLIQPYRDIDKAPIHNWDIKGLKTGVKVYGSLNDPSDNDSVWTVEAAFPWNAFKELTNYSIPPKEGDQWRINFSRVEWKTEVKNGKYRKIINPEIGKPFPEDNWVWSPQGVVNMHYPEMWGFVQFSTEPPGDKKVFFIENKTEYAKWYLRQIYYRERNFFGKNGNFTKDYKSLELGIDNIPGFILPPVIECTRSLFEASVVSEDGKLRVSIRNDGLTWISKVR